MGNLSGISKWYLYKNVAFVFLMTLYVHKHIIQNVNSAKSFMKNYPICIFFSIFYLPLQKYAFENVSEKVHMIQSRNFYKILRYNSRQNAHFFQYSCTLFSKMSAILFHEILKIFLINFSEKFTY